MESFKAHINLTEVGPKGQNAIQKSTVGVVGVGGLGCPALQCLASAGIGTLLLIDGDVIEESNLARQFLFGKKDIGKNKAKVAAERLSELYPSVEFLPYESHLIAENSEKLLGDCHIVLDCTDDLLTSYLIDDICHTLSIPLVYAAVHKYQGQLTVFRYQGEQRLNDLFPSDVKSAGINCSETGILSTVTATFGTFQANEVLKILTGFGEVLHGKMLIMDMRNFGYQLLDIKTPALPIGPNKVSIESAGLSLDQLLKMIEKEAENIRIFDLGDDNIDMWDARVHVKRVMLNEVKEEYSITPEGMKIVLICERDKKSRAAVQLALRSKELHKVYYLKGGTKAIKEKYEEGIC